jgi:hypothetical protein
MAVPPAPSITLRPDDARRSMPHSSQADHYEALQVSPRADQDTIERVFRHLAKRFHPDNTDTGDAERFNEVVAAYRALSDPEARATYDLDYTEVQRRQWKIFDQASSTDGIEADRRIRLGLLTVLYQARRRDVADPGVGILDLERILDCPRDLMEFHLWYLKESGWIERMDTGHLAITVEGVDRLHEESVPWSTADRRIGPGRRGADRESRPAANPESGAAPGAGAAAPETRAAAPETGAAAPGAGGAAGPQGSGPAAQPSAANAGAPGARRPEGESG